MEEKRFDPVTMTSHRSIIDLHAKRRKSVTWVTLYQAMGSYIIWRCGFHWVCYSSNVFFGRPVTPLPVEDPTATAIGHGLSMPIPNSMLDVSWRVDSQLCYGCFRWSSSGLGLTAKQGDGGDEGIGFHFKIYISHKYCPTSCSNSFNLIESIWTQFALIKIFWWTGEVFS